MRSASPDSIFESAVSKVTDPLTVKSLVAEVRVRALF